MYLKNGIFLIFCTLIVSRCQKLQVTYSTNLTNPVEYTQNPLIEEEEFLSYFKIHNQTNTSYFSRDSMIILESRRQGEPFPVFLHCRGILQFCKKVCVERFEILCREWEFLCAKAGKKEQLKRCHEKCVYSIRVARLKYPIPPKLPRDVKNRHG